MVKKDNVNDNEAWQLVDHPNDSKKPIEEPIEVPLRCSQREKRHALSNDYIQFNESDYNIGQVNDQMLYQ